MFVGKSPQSYSGPSGARYGIASGLIRLRRAQVDAIDVQFTCSNLDNIFDQVAGFGPTRATVGRRRVGIRQHRVDRYVRGGNVVDAREGHDLAERRQELAIGADIGTQIGQHVQSHAEELAVHAQRQFDVADIIARMLVGEDHFRALARPLDRSSELARRPQR